ncbi:cyclin-H-like [Asterias rubens]|uniref:cyclin-H-like n=1 Tax=Asterias rubens TaxID=7604 RepID=UPI001454F831|nr:cyclin-H-like [Asterias rubens]
MFQSSTQKRCWTFSSEKDVEILRQECNTRFQEQHHLISAKRKDPGSFFLSANEEYILCRHYEHLLRDFCRRFEPPMPPSVKGSSCAYFKRFYLRNTVMDYHPKFIMLTCVYLACKIEEFNVSITQFCGNLSADQERAAELILGHELLVMQQLDFHLTIHNLFRPLEGFLIDIKTRFPSLESPEQLRKSAEEFLHRSLASNVSLLYSPSQISLAALVTSAGRQKVNIDKYVTDFLLSSGKKEDLKELVMSIKKIRYLVSNIPPLDIEVVKSLEKKLDQCLNQELNPDSAIYKKKVQELLDAEDEDFTLENYTQNEESKRREAELLMSV